MDFAKEIEDFLGDEKPAEKVEEEAVVTPESTETETEEGVGTSSEEEIETTPKVETEVKPEVKPEVKADEEVVEGAESIDSLRAKIDELMGQVTELKKGPDLKLVETEVKPEVEIKVEDLVKTYLGDVHIDDVVTKPELFIKVLKVVEERAREDAVRRVLTQIPNITLRYIQQHSALQKATKEFYETNEDLTQARKTVGAFANEVSSEHPDWTLEKVLGETADRARKALGLKKQAQGSVKPKAGDTGLVKGPGKTGGKKGKVNVSVLEKEILDLIG
jgi:hypothetical protein